MSDEANLYDAFPYFSQPILYAHIDRLAACGRLFGVDVPPLRTARVLELGCSSAGHLLPMAEEFPDARFVGVDLSIEAIEEARGRVAEVGLDNLTLVHASVTDLPSDLGSFDYIIAHGLYSWVPAPVRQGLMEATGRHLAPNGVAYLSYNCLPGWYMRGMIRDVMLFHTGRFEAPGEKVAQARGLLDFLVDGTPSDSLYQKILKNEQKLLSEQPDYYLFHDHLSPVNHALWFHEFVAHAGSVGLQYLAEPDLVSMFPTRFPPAIQAHLATVRDVVRQEQYMDFLTNRAFRRTLLVRDGLTLDRRVSPQRLEGLLLRSFARPTTPLDLSPAVEITFQNGLGDTLTTGKPLLKAALAVLSEQPQGVDFDELLARSQERLGRAPQPDDRALVGGNLLHGVSQGVVHLAVEPHRYERVVSERPLATRVARMQAGRADPVVANRRHEAVVVEEFHRNLILLCDGTRNRSQLVADLISRVLSGALVIHKGEERVQDPALLFTMFTRVLEGRLADLGQWALLVG